jgi:toxin-antitoxin system PIN domain toxin
VTYLLDVNVLIALFDSGHRHHEAAHRWLLAVGLPSFATCPLTENGFVRIVSGSSYPTAQISTAETLAALKAFCALPGHVFWADSVSLTDGTLFDLSRIQDHQQISDLYLAGLAHRNGGKLASFDTRIAVAALVGAPPDLVAVIPTT